MSLTLAAGYVASLCTVYYLAVRWYRSSAAKAAAASGPKETWFTGHPARDAYIEAYNAMPDEMGPNEVKKLKAYLMKRAVVDVQRVFSLREDRSTLALLLRNGAIGDDLWNEFTEAETEINGEIQEVIREAEDLERGWGGQIFQQASQIIAQAQQQESQQQSRAQATQDEAQARAEAEARRAQLERELLEKEAADKKKAAAARRSSKAKR